MLCDIAIRRGRKGRWGGIIFPYIHSKTASVDVIQLAIDDPHIMLVKQVFEGLKRIIFQMFVADIIECQLSQHEWQVAHLHYPQTIIIKYLADVAEEGMWVFEI